MNHLKRQCEDMLGEVKQHLHEELLPFWLEHGRDLEQGGFLTYLDTKGNPTGETMKTLLCQARMIFTYASAHRAGLGEGKCLEIAREGVEFVLEHFWDREHGGWYWTAERNGSPINKSKLTYGMSFMIYGLSEYALASGDARGLEWALRTYETLQVNVADNAHGGYYEFLEEDWSRKSPGKYGGDRKSFDVHMHLMEAFTTLYEATGKRAHKEKTMEMIELICSRILHPTFRTGIAQFGLDWSPLRQILFADVWGSDRDVTDDEGRPLNNTSFGHNVEFVWLLKHGLGVLGLDEGPYKPIFRRVFDHCVAYGIDWEHGGVYCEGPHDGPAREKNKEFWQQAECLVGMLDGYLLFHDNRYLEAYSNVHRFVMDYVINHDVGEWYPLFDENNRRLWDYMGHAWKINYHTVRSMIQTEKRLKLVISALS